MRLEVVATEEVHSESPVVRLHKEAFYPQMRTPFAERHQNQQELVKIDALFKECFASRSKRF
jgi:hypothetical protein